MYKPAPRYTLRQKVLVFRAMAKEHPALLGSTVTGIILVVAFAYLENKEGSAFYYTALLALMASVVAAGLVGILNLHYEISQNENRKHLEMIIGHNEWDKVAIILPILDYENQKEESDTTKEFPSQFRFSVKEKGTKVRLKFGYEDLDAARKISSAFTSLDIEQPKLHFDDFATSSIFPSETPKTERKHKKLDRITTFICVGLHSNELSMRVNGIHKDGDIEHIEPDNPPLFCVDRRNKQQLMICDLDVVPLEWHNEKVKKNVIHADHAHNTKPEDLVYKTDYGLIAKQRLKIGSRELVFIIIGGGSSRCTKKLGRWFRDHYHTIPGMQVDTEHRRSYVEDKQFAFGFELKPINDSIYRGLREESEEPPKDHENH